MGAVLVGAGTTLKRHAHGIDWPGIGNKTRGYEREFNDAPGPSLRCLPGPGPGPGGRVPLGVCPEITQASRS